MPSKLIKPNQPQNISTFFNFWIIRSRPIVKFIGKVYWNNPSVKRGAKIEQLMTFTSQMGRYNHLGQY